MTENEKEMFELKKQLRLALFAALVDKETCRQEEISKIKTAMKENLVTKIKEENNDEHQRKR